MRAEPDRMEKSAMATQTQTQAVQDRVEEKLRKVRELYADAPEVGRIGLEKMMAELKDAAASEGQQRVTSAGRTGLRLGKVSELTGIMKFAPGGAKRLRALLEVLGGNFQGADKVGTLHDMRFVFLDNDTKMLFATTYDGDWEPYIVDFSTKIPHSLDVLFSNMEGYPAKGMHDPAIGDWIASHQITADGWYVASPNLTVAEVRKLEKVGAAVEELLDKIG
jgi:hypothetical protein